MISSYLDRLAPDRIAGWALETDEPQKSLELAIVVDGALVTRGHAKNLRLDLQARYGNGQHGFDFRFDPPLSSHRGHYVSIQVAETGQIVREITMSGMGGASSAGHGIAPLLLTSTGRSGTTVVMHTLAEDPAIAVAGHYPAEFKLLTYYAHVLKVLGASATPDTAIEPDKMHEHQYRVGANPFFDAAYIGQLGDAQLYNDILGRKASGHLARAFGSIMQEFYAEVGRAAGKLNPLFFIEKCDVLSEARDRARTQFEGVKEIVLVRDLRDVYCSSRAFWSVGEEFVRNLSQARELFMQIKRTARPEDTLIVRYEDFVLERDATLEKIGGFLEMGRPLQLGAGVQDTMFARHATSADPGASIGRWKTEMDSKQQGQFRAMLGDFLEVFGY